MMNCPSCNDNISKETFVNHVKKCNPVYFIQEILRFPPESEWAERLKNNDIEIRGMPLDDAIKILEETPHYWYGDDKAYIDFSSGRAFSKESTALTHITTNVKEHSDKFHKLLQESLTKEEFIKLFKWIKVRPPRVIIDVQKVKQVENKLDRTIVEYESKIDSLMEYKKKWLEYQNSDDSVELKRLNDTLARKNTDIYDANYTINKLNQEISHYKEKEAYDITERQKRLGDDMQEVSLLEKMQQKYNKFKEKLESDTDKKNKKFKEEYDKKLEAFEKKEKKYKKKIKTLQHQVDMKTIGSESDSD